MLEMSEEHAREVENILQTIVPNETVWAFGSRVTGNAKPYSDLDLVIVRETPLPPLVISDLREAFDESDLPFQVDIVNWANIDDAFKDIIKKKYFVLNSPKS